MIPSCLPVDFSSLPNLDAPASRAFLAAMPKAELHMHIDGAITPEMMFSLAQRNQVSLPYKTVEDIEKAYQFTNLQSFLDLLYLGASVMEHEQDFYDLTMDYLRHCQAENVLYTEFSFDPQTHTTRGIPFATVIGGILRAMSDARRDLGVESQLEMDFLRHLSAESAMATLEESLPFKEHIVAVGLDSSELGHPPSKFTEVFARARAEGYQIVAHAGEEGPPEYIWEAINLLGVDRIDHGVRADEDPTLMAYLRETQIPLTVCPLSNVRLCVYDDMAQHNILKLMDAGLRVMVNSDDPTYFGGYLNDNYFALNDALQLTRGQALQLAHNSFTSCFISDVQKQHYLDALTQFARSFP